MKRFFFKNQPDRQSIFKNNYIWMERIQRVIQIHSRIKLSVSKQKKNICLFKITIYSIKVKQNIPPRMAAGYKFNKETR